MYWIRTIVVIKVT